MAQKTGLNLWDFSVFFPSPPPKINFNFNLKLVCIVTRQKFYKKNENSFKNLSFILGVNLIDFSNNLKFNEIKSQIILNQK